MREAVQLNWPEYFSEGLLLGIFMISASGFAVLLFHEESPLNAYAPMIRMALMGTAMGVTAIGIFLSPLGKRSGAHINPAVTLTFWSLGKVKSTDAAFYIASQFAGASLGMLVSRILFGEKLAAATVNFVVTKPDANGSLVSFAAEFAMSFVMMTTVLWISNSVRTFRLTPFFAGLLVALFITFESPVSGMSLNPARTFGAALVADQWNSVWVYFTAPPLAMLFAAFVYVRLRTLARVFCAKIAHFGATSCIFECRYGELSSFAKTDTEAINATE